MLVVAWLWVVGRRRVVGHSWAVEHTVQHTVQASDWISLRIKSHITLVHESNVAAIF